MIQGISKQLFLRKRLLKGDNKMFDKKDIHERSINVLKKIENGALKEEDTTFTNKELMLLDLFIDFIFIS